MRSNSGVIRIPEGAIYSLEDTIAVIVYATTLTAKSPEATVSGLKQKMPNAAIPSADTVLNYIYENDKLQRI